MTRTEKLNGARLLCPVCGKRLLADEQALRCVQGHTFDIARQGYVNLLPGKGAFYPLELFRNRREVFDHGFYAPLLGRMEELILRHAKSEKIVLLDAGCGEGYYAGNLLKNRECVKVAFDISREAVQLGAQRYEDVTFIVADLKRIPLPDHSVDCVLDVLTPADYSEFTRVLKKNGRVLKAIPGENYLKELRALAQEQLRSGPYESGRVKDYFAEHMQAVQHDRVTYTLPVTPDEARAFARMTPMLQRVDVEALDLSGVRDITIDMELLVGKKK